MPPPTPARPRGSDRSPPVTPAAHAGRIGDRPAASAHTPDTRHVPPAAPSCRRLTPARAGVRVRPTRRQIAWSSRGTLGRLDVFDADSADATGGIQLDDEQ